MAYCQLSIKLERLLTHWGWGMHVGISKPTIIGSDNCLLPGRHQAIIWTNAGVLLIEPSRTNFSVILIEIHTFSFKKRKCILKCLENDIFLSLNMLTH